MSRSSETIMTNKHKARVRARMAREGISYSEALRRESATEEHAGPTAPERIAASAKIEVSSLEGVPWIEIAAGRAPHVTPAALVGRSGDLDVARAMAAAAAGTWVANGAGLTTSGSTPEAARAAWFADATIQLPVPVAMLDRDDWRRDELRQQLRRLRTDGDPHIIDVGVVTDGAGGAQLRVYIEREGARPTESWFGRLAAAVQAAIDFDPVGDFEDYGSIDKE